jgi:hypothetical protein
MVYAARHPGHAGALVLQSTMARFDLGRLVRSSTSTEVLVAERSGPFFSPRHSKGIGSGLGHYGIDLSGRPSDFPLDIKPLRHFDDRLAEPITHSPNRRSCSRLKDAIRLSKGISIPYRLIQIRKIDN